MIEIRTERVYLFDDGIAAPPASRVIWRGKACEASAITCDLAG